MVRFNNSCVLESLSILGEQQLIDMQRQSLCSRQQHQMTDLGVCAIDVEGTYVQRLLVNAPSMGPENLTE